MATTAYQKAKKAEHTPRVVAELRTRMDTGTNANAAKVSVDKPLTAQQKAFGLAVAQGDSIPNAMHRSGYDASSTTYGYRMVHMPNIKAYIAAEKAKFEADNTLTRRKVFEMHVEAYDMAKLMSEPATMVSAAREIGKMAGYYEPQKREVTVNVNGQIAMEQMNRMTDADLLKLIEQAIGGQPETLGLEHDEEDDE